MPRPHTPSTIPLPLPSLGYNCASPINAVPSEYAVNTENWEISNQKISIRSGYVIHQTISGVDTIMALGTHGNAIYAITYKASTGQSAIYDVTAAPAVVVAAYGTTTTAFASSNYGGRLIFSGGTGYDTESRMYDGTVWAAPGLTVGGAPTNSWVMCSYKNAVYVFSTLFGSNNMYYTGTGLVTGAMTTYDLTTIFRDFGTIFWAGVLTSPQNRAIDSLLAIGNSTGEVLVYAGDNPVATNWGLVGRLQTGKPLSYQGIIEYNGDILVLTSVGLVSVRALLDNGSDNTSSVSFSVPIDPYFTTYYRLATYSQYVNACIFYAKDISKIIIYLKGYLDPGFQYGSSATVDPSYDTIIYYDISSAAWYTHRIAALIGTNSRTNPNLIYFNGALYYVADNVIAKYSLSIFMDQLAGGTYQGYTAYLYTPYLSYDSFDRNKTVEGVEIICNTDLSSEANLGGTIGMQITKNFSSSGASSMNLAPYPMLQNGYNQIMFSVGNTGTYLQNRLQITTSYNTSIKGFQLYGWGTILK